MENNKKVNLEEILKGAESALKNEERNLTGKLVNISVEVNVPGEEQEKHEFNGQLAVVVSFDGDKGVTFIGGEAGPHDIRTMIEALKTAQAQLARQGLMAITGINLPDIN